MSDLIELHPMERVFGTLRVPGDKSVSHRSLLFAAIASGTSRVRGLATGEDVRTTLRAVETLGVRVRTEDGVVVIEGTGWSGLDRDPQEEPLEIDCGNSGTTARLLLGLLAGRSGRFRLIGDASLSRRPMGRVVRPLTLLGAEIEGGDCLPLVVHGRTLRGAELTTEVPSAQVKSALLLAGLQAEGATVVREERLSRDHTERLLGAMGAPLRALGPTAWQVEGGAAPLTPIDLTVPGDPSSAAYAVALACARPGSELVVEDLLLNPTRLGFYELLRRMEADLSWEVAVEHPEPRGRLTARGSTLKGATIAYDDVVAAIDELPLIAVTAAAASGSTHLSGLGELRHKETDRLAMTTALLRAAGVVYREDGDDGLVVQGGKLSPGKFDSGGDHRIAMCAAVAAGLALEGTSELAGAEWVRISYPEFFADLDRLRAPALPQDG